MKLRYFCVAEHLQGSVRTLVR